MMHRFDQMTRDSNVERVKTSFIPQELCDRCDGTGNQTHSINQLYSMYQTCEKCNGTGTVKLGITEDTK